MEWNEWGFRPPLCTYRLNWAERTSWGWWDEWDDTALQTQDSKFEPWRSEAEHATSRSRRLPQYWIIASELGRNNLFQWNLKARVSGAYVHTTLCYRWLTKPRSALIVKLTRILWEIGRIRKIVAWFFITCIITDG